MIFEKSWSKKVAKSNTYIFKNIQNYFFSNRIGLFWFRFPPVLFARGYWFCGSSMGWGLRPRGYSGTRRYVRECRLYAVEGFTGTNSLYGFRMGEGGFGAPPVGDVTHGIFLGFCWWFFFGIFLGFSWDFLGIFLGVYRYKGHHPHLGTTPTGKS